MLDAYSPAASGLIECGLDEAGRGPLAGPVVAAAVLWPRGILLPGLTDSKQLTDVQREALVPEIKRLAHAWAVAEVSPQDIDQINILKASFKAMHLAAEQVMQCQEVDLLLVDGNRFKPYPFVAHQCIVKGDAKYLSIAAASILAKTTRDALMRNLALEYPFYGWESNMGYPAPAHIKGMEEYGITPYHRLSFSIKGRSVASFPMVKK